MSPKANITIHKKDGSVKRFISRYRRYGKIRYEIGFVVIEDEYGGETAIPTADIIQIEKTPSV